MVVVHWSLGLLFLFACLLFCILVTSKVISRRVLICDNARSWRLYSVSPLGDQDASTMTWYFSQSHYRYSEPTSPCPILIMLSAWLGYDKYHFLRHSFDLTRVQTRKVRIPQSPKTGDRCSTHSTIPSGRLLKTCTAVCIGATITTGRQKLSMLSPKLQQTTINDGIEHAVILIHYWYWCR